MNPPSINLNLLLVFDAIMSERQVSRAAQRLGRSQSAVSHALKRLRETLDDDLFVRKEYEMVPTPRALELSTHVSAALADLHGALDRFLEFDPTASTRHFRLGMSDATIFMFLPDLVSRFQNKSASISVNVQNVSPAQGYELLRTGSIDCMILGNVPPPDDNFVQETILTEKFLCGFSKTSENPHSTLSLNAYLDRPHLHVAQDGQSPGAADIALGAMGLKRKIVATVPNYLVVPAMLDGTELIATFGEAPLIAMAATHNLSLSRPPLELPDVKFCFVIDKRSNADPAIQWLKMEILNIADDIGKKKETLYAERPELFLG